MKLQIFIWSCVSSYTNLCLALKTLFLKFTDIGGSFAGVYIYLHLLSLSLFFCLYFYFRFYFCCHIILIIVFYRIFTKAHTIDVVVATHLWVREFQTGNREQDLAKRDDDVLWQLPHDVHRARLDVNVANHV